MRVREGDLRDMIDTNLLGCVYMTRAVSASMLRRKDTTQQCSIVNIGSIVGGSLGSPGQSM
jgi:NAD(P)-dependent dehydrogenase (short-subunit alcohol dehydrogenase family)